MGKRRRRHERATGAVRTRRPKLPRPGSDDWTYAHAREMCDQISDHLDDWQGVPVPLSDFTLHLHDRHPMAPLYREIDTADVEFEMVVCGPNDIDDDEAVVNHWYDGKRNRDVYIFQRSGGRAFAGTVPRSPDQSMERLKFAVQTLGASDAWDLNAEATAMEKLCGLLSERQRRHYLLTGSFLETSPRSRLTYLFRRSRPTIVLTPRRPWWRLPMDEMRCLAVLCLHPIGFYGGSWAGCMVPSDDVIAHLLMMRGDEAMFWRKANQHEPWKPEAGL